MRDPARREAADISAAWFIVPMSVAAAVLLAMATQPDEPEAAPALPLPAATEAPATALPMPDAWPEATEHVQAFQGSVRPASALPAGRPRPRRSPH